MGIELKLEESTTLGAGAPAPIDEKHARDTAFRAELREVINRHSRENGSDTPDYLLAEFMAGCLDAFDRTVKQREKWYGRGPKLAPPPIAAALNATHEAPQAPPPRTNTFDYRGVQEPLPNCDTCGGTGIVGPGLERCARCRQERV